MRNFQDAFETRKRSFISAFSICMTVPLSTNPSGILIKIKLKKKLYEHSFNVIQNRFYRGHHDNLNPEGNTKDNEVNN